MQEQYGGSSIELGKDRFKKRIAQIQAVAVGFHNDAVQTQLIQRITHFCQRVIDIRQWQRRESAEFLWVAAHDIGGEFVDVSGQFHPLGSLFEKPYRRR